MTKPLPSDKELHALRLKYAQAAIDGYIAATPDKQHEDMEETLTDILTDLRHFATAKGIAFAGIVNRSASHFQAEQDELTSNTPTT